MDKLNLETLIERMEPYDCHRKEDFIKLLEDFPELKEHLISELEDNEEWAQKAATGEVKFIINDSRYKTPKTLRSNPCVVLNFIRSVPVVSLNV